MKSIAIVDAPSNLGLRPLRPGHEPGVWRCPQSLRERGLARRIGATDGGAIPRPSYSSNENTETGFRNGPALARFSAELAAKIGEIIDQDQFPLVLGGDCSVLLGGMLALRRRGRFGLCFIDGHNDFCYPRDPKRRGDYTAAGLDLALVTGHGPETLANIDQLRPYVREDDAVAVGFFDDPADHKSFAIEKFYESRIERFDAGQVRLTGARETAEAALRLLGGDSLEGFWIHLDVDVLHQSVMPAVDSPNPGGLTFAELTTLLKPLVCSPHAVGMELTIFDPELDPAGKYGAALVEMLARSFPLRSTAARD